MKPVATIANLLWNATHLPALLRFERALEQPEKAQQACLQRYLRQHGDTAFGRAHGLASIHNYAAFTRRVPLMEFEDLEPWITRIRQGESQVLTRDPVTRLLPTSGSAGARKLIPFTSVSQGELNAAIGPWLLDLSRQCPGIIGGPAYWSLSPVVNFSSSDPSVVPIGFDIDTAYLGGARQWLATAVMAVPAALGQVRELTQFRYLTLLFLLRQRDLRLISIWHPSFLTLLLDTLYDHWDDLLMDIQRGHCKYKAQLPLAVIAGLSLRPLPERAEELRQADAYRPETLWPKLKLISCWGDGAAEIAITQLAGLFPKTQIQPKGLLATEACITIPFTGQHPLAINSHFYEFMAETGKIFRAHELRPGQTYEVIVTTGSGLWRYRLQDIVRVDGFVGRTPSLRFLGRARNVSDLCGEKLSEILVLSVLQAVTATLKQLPALLFLAPETDAKGNRYTLYTDVLLPENFGDMVDQGLRQNPHYAYCRDLGQLQPVNVFHIAERATERFFQRELAAGKRLGELKPIAFSRASGWSAYFRSDDVGGAN